MPGRLSSSDAKRLPRGLHDRRGNGEWVGWEHAAGAGAVSVGFNPSATERRRLPKGVCRDGATVDWASTRQRRSGGDPPRGSWPRSGGSGAGLPLRLLLLNLPGRRRRSAATGRGRYSRSIIAVVFAMTGTSLRLFPGSSSGGPWPSIGRGPSDRCFCVAGRAGGLLASGSTRHRVCPPLRRGQDGRRSAPTVRPVFLAFSRLCPFLGMVRMLVVCLVQSTCSPPGVIPYGCLPPPCDPSQGPG